MYLDFHKVVPRSKQKKINIKLNTINFTAQSGTVEAEETVKLVAVAVLGEQLFLV